MGRAVAIVNPKAAGGRTLRAWPRFESAIRTSLDGLETLQTGRPEHAVELTRQALRQGAELVVAVGGDGTANEVVNGFFDAGAPINSQARFGFVPVGTGGDLQRTLRLPHDPDGAARALAAGRSQLLDVIRMRLRAADGSPLERICVNLTSFGMGGEVSVYAKSCFLTRVNGKAAFLWATLATALRYRGKRVRLFLDDAQAPRELNITNVALGNGKFHGGGMLPCPLAEMDDGLIDVTTIERLNMFELIRDLRMLYSGAVYDHPKTARRQVRRMRAESDEDVRIEVDGEALGMLPLEAEIQPRALRLAVG